MHRATKLTLLTISMNSSLNCFQWLPRVGTYRYIHNSDHVIVYKDQVMREGEDIRSSRLKLWSRMRLKMICSNKKTTERWQQENKYQKEFTKKRRKTNSLNIKLKTLTLSSINYRNRSLGANWKWKRKVSNRLN